MEQSAAGLPLINADPPKLGKVRAGDAVTPVLTFANAALGAGILAYPFAFRGAGLALGPCLTAFVAACSFGSLCTIMGCMARVQATLPGVQSYGELVTAGIGRRAPALRLCVIRIGGKRPTLIFVMKIVFCLLNSDEDLSGFHEHVQTCPNLLRIADNLKTSAYRVTSCKFPKPMYIRSNE